MLSSSSGCPKKKNPISNINNCRIPFQTFEMDYIILLQLTILEWSLTFWACEMLHCINWNFSRPRCNAGRSYPAYANLGARQDQMGFVGCKPPGVCFRTRTHTRNRLEEPAWIIIAFTHGCRHIQKDVVHCVVHEFMNKKLVFCMITSTTGLLWSRRVFIHII